MMSRSLIDAFRQRAIFGFHGNTRSAVDRYGARDFRRQGLPGDWLGSGLYFWLDAPSRAWEWADDVVRRDSPGANQTANDAAVMIAELHVNDRWIDLLDRTPWFDSFQVAARNLQRSGLLPPQRHPLTASQLHRRDFALIEKAVNDARLHGVPVDAIRAAFIEGDPATEQSALYSRAHVQVAVRNPDVIGRVEVLDR